MVYFIPEYRNWLFHEEIITSCLFIFNLSRHLVLSSVNSSPYVENQGTTQKRIKKTWFPPLTKLLFSQFPKSSLKSTWGFLEKELTCVLSLL